MSRAPGVIALDTSTENPIALPISISALTIVGQLAVGPKALVREGLIPNVMSFQGLLNTADIPQIIAKWLMTGLKVEGDTLSLEWKKTRYEQIRQAEAKEVIRFLPASEGKKGEGQPAPDGNKELQKATVKVDDAAKGKKVEGQPAPDVNEELQKATVKVDDALSEFDKYLQAKINTAYLARTAMTLHAAEMFFLNGGQRLHLIILTESERPEDVLTADKFKEIMPLGMVESGFLAAPGYTDKTCWDAIRKLCGERDREGGTRERYFFGLLDVQQKSPQANPPQQSNEEDGHSTACYTPWIIRTLTGPNPNEPVEVRLPPSAAVAGLFAKRDLDPRRGEAWPAAGLVVQGASKPDHYLDESDLPRLYEQGINFLVTNLNGQVEVHGCRTLSRDQKVQQISVARILMKIRLQLKRDLGSFLYSPNDESTRRNVKERVESRLEEFVQRRQLEAFQVTCGTNNNSFDDQRAGKLNVLVNVRPTYAVEFVTITIVQQVGNTKLS